VEVEMRVSDILNKERIKVKLRSKNKPDVIKELVDLMGSSDSVLDNKEVLKTIIEREKASSTGIGNGVAIPHGKCAGVKNMIGSLGIVKEGIPFDSIDGKPANIVFMLVAPIGPSGPHIKALSVVSRILNSNDTRRKLLNCNTPEEVASVFENEEKKYT